MLCDEAGYRGLIISFEPFQDAANALGHRSDVMAAEAPKEQEHKHAAAASGRTAYGNPGGCGRGDRGGLGAGGMTLRQGAMATGWCRARPASGRLGPAMRSVTRTGSRGNAV